MNLGKQKKNKELKFHLLFLHLIQIIHTYITQLRIPIKSLREIIIHNLKAEFSNEKIGVKKGQYLRYECFESLFISKEYAFKNINKTLTLKTPMFYNSYNVIYVIISAGYLEDYIGELSVDKVKSRDKVRVYKQHIKQPEH